MSSHPAAPLPAGTVVVDGLGGDHAPAAVLAGARQAADAGVDLVVVGPDGSGLPTITCTQQVAMDDDPALALRRRPPPSIRVASRVVAASPGTALVSAGSTGATVAAALLDLGRLPGVRRPVVGVRLPVGGPTGVVLVDAGGDPDPDAAVLDLHAALGRAYAIAGGVQEPRVGLLNVGAEPGKGNALARAAHDVLVTTQGFVGNVEPGAVLAGAVDVVVTDGFTGNILLKTLEASAAGAGAARPAGDRAAVLLGVRGTVLVGHGAWSATDVAAAVIMAARALETDLAGTIAEVLTSSR